MGDHISKFRLGKKGPETTVILTDGLVPRQLEPGLYHVTYDSQSGKLTVRPTDKVTTSYAAVNGVMNHLDRAAIVTLDKVCATTDLKRDRPPVEFTLFHLPNLGLTHDVRLAAAEKIGVTTPDAMRLFEILEAGSKAGQITTWCLHSRGASVFDAAVRHADRRHLTLSGQTAAVYSGASNDFTMRENLQEGGVALLGRGFYNSPVDLVPQVIGMNTLNPFSIVGSLLNAPALATDASPHTWHPVLTKQDYGRVPDSQWAVPGKDLRNLAVRVEYDMDKMLTENPAPRQKLASLIAESVEHAAFQSVSLAGSPEGPKMVMKEMALPVFDLPAREPDSSESKRVFPNPAPSIGRGPGL